MKNVYIYTDKGVAEQHIPNLINWAAFLFENRSINSIHNISAEEIIDGTLEDDDILIIPGGQARFYTEKLFGKGNQNIRNFVKSGGILIGICGGAYYASSEIDFIGKEFKIKVAQESGDDLGLFSGVAKGTIEEIAPLYDDEKSATEVEIVNSNEETFSVYYNGGPMFFPNDDEVEIKSPFSYKLNNGNASIIKSIEKGKIFLFGFHPELSSEEINNEVKLLFVGV